jgi:hypothetical protein
MSEIQSTRWTRTVQYDPNTKEYFVDLGGIAERMGWDIETELEWVVENNKAVLKKKEKEEEV